MKSAAKRKAVPIRALPGKSTDAKRQVQVPFTFRYETHDRKAFVADGHSLMALRHLDKKGNPVQGSHGDRKWGDTVHILTLIHPHADDPTDEAQQVLRKMSDSLDDVLRMVQEELPRSLYGLFAMQFIQRSQKESFEKVSRERNSLRAFVAAKLGDDVAEKAMAGGL